MVLPTPFLNIHRSWRLIHRPLPQRPLQQLHGPAPAVAFRGGAGGDGGAVKDDVGRKLGGGLEEEPGRNVILVDLPIENGDFP